MAITLLPPQVILLEKHCDHNRHNNLIQAVFARILIVAVFLLILITSIFHNRQFPSTEKSLFNPSTSFADVPIRPRLYLKPDAEGVVLDDLQAYRSNLLIKREHDLKTVQIHPITLNINESDVLVMMHIQKTGGTTFENHLVGHTDIQPPCDCEDRFGDRMKCFCHNDKGQDWLFNRHAVGWACGVHADFTELTTCVDHWYRSQENEERPRRYHYISLIRDPVNRFLSEWQHVRRGATWKECRLHCDGRDATLEEAPFCFQWGNWSSVQFEEFLACPHNMAVNRQTRMLANMSLADCYRTDSNKTRFERDEIMLQSAKDNLSKFFDFFGILEYSYECQTLFQKTFKGLKFTKRIDPKGGALGMNYVMLSEESWNRIIELNSLDIRLYQYAKDLFFQRLKKVKIPIQPKIHESKYVSEGFTYTMVEM